MDIDIWEVVDAAATKPFGFEPGPGMGGHCMPVDPFHLDWRARHFDFFTEFIEAAGKINQQMPYWCVERIERALDGAGLATRGARIGIFGVSYKAGASDARESPAVKIIGLLRLHGADVRYHDEYLPELSAFDLRSVSVDEALDCDVAVIATAHPGVDHMRILREAPITVDLRGATRGGDRAALPPSPSP